MNSIITEIQFQPIKPRGGHIGFITCVIDNKFYASSIGVYSKLNDFGYRLTYPTKIIGGREINIFHPITKELGGAIEEAVFKKVKEVMKGGSK